MTRASGCRVWGEDGREYVDFVMALGAVALGYGHPDVNRAAAAAIAAEPTREWLQMLRTETERAGAVLIFDEIKTAFRLAIGGATERYAVKPVPDLVVVGKALANGFPLAAVGGRADLMAAAGRTWI